MSRNQPTVPARASTAPRMLTDMLVTNPAKIKVRPNARTIGQTVGAGSCMVDGVVSRVSIGDSEAILFPVFSAADDVDRRENDHPHGVHKMPVKGQNIDALGVLLSYISKQGEQQYRCDAQQAYRDVEGMQPNERIVGGSEKVGLNRKTFVVDQVAPLTSCAGEKNHSEGECQKPPQCEGTNLCALQRFHGELNRQTARKQTNREEDRDMQHVFGHGPRQTPADVKKIGHDKNGKNRTLGRNQAIHPDAAA